MAKEEKTDEKAEKLVLVKNTKPAPFIINMSKYDGGKLKEKRLLQFYPAGVTIDEAFGPGVTPVASSAWSEAKKDDSVKAKLKSRHLVEMGGV